MSDPEITFFGMDTASKDGDLNCEVAFRRLPDGAIEIVSANTWHHDLELEAIKQAPPSAERE
jgi:hypothetical protein